MANPIVPFFKPTQHEPNRFILAFSDDLVLLLPDLTFPSEEDLARFQEPTHRFDIAKNDRQTFSLYLWDAALEVNAPFEKRQLRSILPLVGDHLLEPLIRAKQLVHWLQDNRFCGRCGAPFSYFATMSSLKCTACGQLSFPKLSPACIVLITRGDEILLARSYHYANSMYSLIAGFVEAGESAEACVVREVKEEVGLEIEDLEYFGTQPWPFPHSFMIGFFARYKSGEIIIQEEELEDAKWFTKKTLPDLPYSTSIAYQMIQTWLQKH